MNYSNKIKGEKPVVKREEIKNPWLIQRAQTRAFEKHFLTGNYLKLEYMGSAEFEFGAIPAFQRRLHAKLNSLEIFEVEHNGLTLFMLCDPIDSNPYSDVLKQLIENKIRLKEGSNLNRLSGEYAEATNTWLDLTNDLAFALNRETLENLRVTVPNSIAYMDAQAQNA